MKIQLFKKSTALLCAASILAQACLPYKSYALGSGPSQPEFSNFESVSTSQMVDPFTGDFTYNLALFEVPGPNGGGYPISLSYHSGSSPEEEASWVGYGWTLNAGAIMRNKQGFPDDANGDDAIYYNKIGKNYTIVAGTQEYVKAANIPIVNSDFVNDLANLDAELGLSQQLTYNNHTGLSMQFVDYFNANIACFTANLSFDNGEYRYTSEFNPGWFFGVAMGHALAPLTSNHTLYKGAIGQISEFFNSSAGQAVTAAFAVNSNHSAYASKSYSLYNNSAPTVLQDYTGFSGSIKLGAFLNPLCVPVGFGGAVFGTYTQQVPVEQATHSYFGYLYSHNADNDSEDTETDGINALMDYTVEKQDVYNMRDNYLPIPHSAADMFTVVGEGIGGTFRAYSSRIGHFRPNQQTGTSSSFLASGELGIGTAISLTVSASISANTEDYNTDDDSDLENFAEDAAEKIVGGGHNLRVGKWEDISNYTFSDEGHEAYCFRFIGDMGGEASYNEITDGVEFASLSGHSPSYPSSLDHSVNGSEGLGRSVYIGYHTNAEMMNTDGSGNYYQRYSHIDTDRSEEGADTDQIAEFSITNKNGMNYVYGLPLYAKNEYELSVDIQNNEHDAEYLDINTIVYKDIDNYIDYVSGSASSLSDNQKLVGSFRENEYAISYLLTQVTAPNYIDLTNNGPSSDDIGGWTKFNYTKKYGSGKDSNADGDYNDMDWFHWRMPYRGLYYNRGIQSDPNDDMGSFSSGDKEIYYLESIETSTHKAVFEITHRYDGMEAPSDNGAGLADAAQGIKTLSKLNKITLYAKGINGADDKVIKRIYLEYDYSCFPGIPNSDIDEGKLTLKKLWTEYTEVSNSEISPYEFKYNYPTRIDYPAKPVYEKNEETGIWENTDIDEYQYIEDYGDLLNQEPSYSIHASDRWGSYRANGADLDENLFAWVDQTPDVDFDSDITNDFDPAAWQLKQIILPTGAQIHIQYEEDDYQYVQNRKAMAMVKLSTITDGNGQEFTNGNSGTETIGDRYYLDLENLGISNNEDAITDMKEFIQKVMIDGYDSRKPEKAYFNFLYNINTDEDAPGLDDYNADFVDGYVRIRDVEVDNDGAGRDGLYVILGGESATEENWECPRDACIEFYKSTRGNLSEYDSNGERTFLTDANDYSETTSSLTIGEAIYELVDRSVQFGGEYSTICLNLNPDYSYIRLPLPYEKKGGGIRVKRLLTYDPGVETDGADKMLYGHEYLYVDYDGHSSGVASNEPIEGREENALIQFLNKREESSDDQVLAAGHDKSQFEGPIGEGILPSPVVGYSRVLVRNIHRAPTHDGISAFEYYTTKDYPFDKRYNGYQGVQYTDLDIEINDDNPKFEILTTIKKLDCWATQGYRFVLNGMNGQMKKQAVYSGDWSSYNSPESLMEVSSVRYNYTEPGEKVNYLSKNGRQGEFTPGKASEIIAESKKVSDESGSSSMSVEFGASICTGVPFPFVIPIPYTVKDETHFYTHVTTQTDYYPPILESTTTFQDGTYSTVYNNYFCQLSGEPIVSSKSGIHDQKEYGTDVAANLTHEGRYFSYAIPATFYYEGMGQKAGYEGYSVGSGDGSGAIITKKFSGDDIYLEFTGDYCDVLEKFTVGDLITAVRSEGTTHGVWNITGIEGNHIHIAGASGFYYNESEETDGYNLDLLILKSARANMLNLGAGSILTYGDEFMGISSRNSDQYTYRESLADYLNDVSDDPSVLLRHYRSISSITAYADGECETYDVYNNGTFWQSACPTCLSEVEDMEAGSFFIDEESGSLMYGDADNTCQAQQLSCLSLCPLYEYDWQGVVSASANTYADSIAISDNVKSSYGIDGNTNTAETAETGKWYMQSSYVYKTELEYNPLSFNSGTYDSFSPFNWGNNDLLSSNWLNATTITDYTPDGKMLQEENILDIKGAEKFGYSNNLAYLIANNATLESVFFEGYEYDYGSSKCGKTYCFEETGTSRNSLSANHAHSGSNSLELDFSASSTGSSKAGYSMRSANQWLSPFKNRTTQEKQNGVSVKIWVKSGISSGVLTLTLSDGSYLDNSVNTEGDLTETNTAALFNEVEFEAVAKTGEWELYEAKITASDWVDYHTTAESDHTYSLAILVDHEYSSATSLLGQNLYIDDMRIQPLNSKMLSYVYDPATYKLLAEFDDQNFGLYYQYNDEGKLIRKKKETVRGMKTLTETQYNIPTQARE
jgi:hypothetical protein